MLICHIYSYDNKFYKLTSNDNEQYVYNSDSKQFETSDLDGGINSYNYYIDDNLLVYTEEGKHRKVKVKYKNNQTYTLPDKIDAFCVQDEKIYYINSYQSLKVHDPATGENSIEKIDDIYRYDGYSPVIICGDYLYFVYEDNEYKNGLYRYSLSDKKIELALENNSILCLNTNGESVFVATEKKGVYAVDENGSEKITNKKAEQVYVFDMDWVYLYDTDGKIYRTKTDGSETENISNNIIDAL